MKDLHVFNELIFSPTSTGACIGEYIAEGTGVGYDYNEWDFTHDASDVPTFTANQLAVFIVPVYGGHVAPLALQRMKDVKGQDTPAAIVVMYGNRHYEQALTELQTFVTERGFRVIAAATFVGEHSYSTPQNPIAEGRPDKQDLSEARNFGKAIMEKFTLNARPETVDAATIEMPEQDEEAMMRFKQTVMGWMKEGRPMPQTPLGNPLLCTHCNECSTFCPAQAISPDTPTETDATRCIKCCSCVKICPSGARTFPTPFAPLLAEHFAKRKENKMLL